MLDVRWRSCLERKGECSDVTIRLEGFSKSSIDRNSHLIFFSFFFSLTTAFLVQLAQIIVRKMCQKVLLLMSFFHTSLHWLKSPTPNNHHRWPKKRNETHLFLFPNCFCLPFRVDLIVVPSVNVVFSLLDSLIGGKKPFPFFHLIVSFLPSDRHAFLSACYAWPSMNALCCFSSRCDVSRSRSHIEKDR